MAHSLDNIIIQNLQLANINKRYKLGHVEHSAPPEVFLVRWLLRQRPAEWVNGGLSTNWRTRRDIPLNWMKILSRLYSAACAGGRVLERPAAPLNAETINFYFRIQPLKLVASDVKQIKKSNELYVKENIWAIFEIKIKQLKLICACIFWRLRIHFRPSSVFSRKKSMKISRPPYRAHLWEYCVWIFHVKAFFP